MSIQKIFHWDNSTPPGTQTLVAAGLGAIINSVEGTLFYYQGDSLVTTGNIAIPASGSSTTTVLGPGSGVLHGFNLGVEGVTATSSSNVQFSIIADNVFTLWSATINVPTGSVIAVPAFEFATLTNLRGIFSTNIKVTVSILGGTIATGVFWVNAQYQAIGLGWGQVVLNDGVGTNLFVRPLYCAQYGNIASFSSPDLNIPTTNVGGLTAQIQFSNSSIMQFNGSVAYTTP